VEGAVRWYASSFPPLPPSVDADTRSWRKEADRILGFWDERLIPDTGACIVTTELMQAFNVWMRSNGHSDWSKELLGSRFKAHEETKRHNVEERRPRNLHGLRPSRPPDAQGDLKCVRMFTSACVFVPPMRRPRTRMMVKSNGPSCPTFRTSSTRSLIN